MPPFDREAALKNAEKAIKRAASTWPLPNTSRSSRPSRATGTAPTRLAICTYAPSRSTKASSSTRASPITSPKRASIQRRRRSSRRSSRSSPTTSTRCCSPATSPPSRARSPTPSSSSPGRRTPRKRGDKKGATEIAIRLGTLDPEDFEARMRAAQLAAEWATTPPRCASTRTSPAGSRKQERTPTRSCRCRRPTISTRPTTRSAAGCSPPISATTRLAARTLAKGVDELKQVAAALEKAGHADAALEVLGEIAEADPPISRCTPTSRSPTSRAATSTRPRPILSPETAGANPALWMTLAEIELRGNRFAEGKTAVVQAMTLDPQPGAGRGRAGLQARRGECRRRLPADRCRGRRRAGAKAISPPPRWRCTSSRRACPRTSSR